MGSLRSRAATLLLWAVVVVLTMPCMPEKSFLAQSRGHIMRRGKLATQVVRAAQKGDDETKVQGVANFNAWLQQSPEQPLRLKRNVANPLYWDLQTRLTAPMSVPTDFGRFVGISGGGKTRTMYEECVHDVNDGIYVTMSKGRNDGSRTLGDMLQRVSDNKMSANVKCCMLTGMFLSHIKFYYEYNSSNRTDKLFLMTQNCGSRIDAYALSMPIPSDDEEAEVWMREMRTCVVRYRGSATLMIDEIQVVRDEELLKQVIRSVEELVSQAIVSGTGVCRRTLIEAMKVPNPGVAKWQWEDIPGPSLLTWSDCEKYLDKYEPQLKAWLVANPAYQKWFSVVRARVLALAVQRCKQQKRKENQAYESILETLYTDLFNSSGAFDMLLSNFGGKASGNFLVVQGTVGGNYAQLLAEYVVFGKLQTEYSDADLENIVGSALAGSEREVLLMEFAKRIPEVASLLPKVIERYMCGWNPSSAGFFFEYPAAYAAAGVANLEDMTFLHQTLAETTGCIETQRDGWYAVMPDTMAGPDVVLFQVTDSSVSCLKVVQAKRLGKPLAGKDLMRAIDSTDLNNVYTQGVDNKPIRKRASERAQIINWFRGLTRVSIERVLVCQQGVSSGESTTCVRLISQGTDPNATFCGHSLWEKSVVA